MVTSRGLGGSARDINPSFGERRFMLDQHAQPSTMDSNRLRRTLLRACWTITIVLWTLAGDMAIDLLGDPIPAHFNLIVGAAMALTVVSLLAPIALGNRDVGNERLELLADEVEALRRQVIESNETWRTLNTLLGSTGERPHLRDVSRINTGPN